MSVLHPVLAIALAASLLLQNAVALATGCCCGRAAENAAVAKTSSDVAAIRCPKCRTVNHRSPSRPEAGTAAPRGMKDCNCRKSDQKSATPRPIRAAQDVLACFAIAPPRLSGIRSNEAVLLTPRVESRSPGVPLRILHCSWQA